MKVTVRLSIQNRIATVEVVPSASALIIKALAEPARDRKKEKNSMSLSLLYCSCVYMLCLRLYISSVLNVLNVLRVFLYYYTVKHHGNITLDDVIKIARTMQPRSLSKDLTV